MASLECGGRSAGNRTARAQGKDTELLVMTRAGRLTGAIALIGAMALAGCVQQRGDTTSLPTSGVYTVGSPYQLNGVWYYPAEDYSYDESGLASVAEPDSGGRVLTNGEIFDPAELTASHKTLPIPSLARVINLDNGRMVVVRINDRGPPTNGRLIHLSPRGAQLLDFNHSGVGKVRVQILAEESRAIAAAARQGTPAAILAKTDGPAPKAAPRGTVEADGPGAGPTVGKTASAGVVGLAPAPPASVPGAVVAGRFLPAPVVAQAPVSGRERLFVQVGSPANAERANQLRARLAALGQPASVSNTAVGKQRLQRVRVGPLDGVERADTVLNQIIQAGLTEAKIVIE